MKNNIPFQRSGTESIRRSPASRTPQSVERLRALWLGRRLTLPLVLLCAVLLARPCGAAPGQWESTGSLGAARQEHTATLLPSGKVLVSGGYGSGSFLSSAELYDPATGTWSSTGSLATARSCHTATLLPSGKVLVAGGYGNIGALSSAELYDPATGSWSGTGSLATARARSHGDAAALRQGAGGRRIQSATVLLEQRGTV